MRLKQLKTFILITNLTIIMIQNLGNFINTSSIINRSIIKKK